jgi:hypothetical protein
MRMNYDTDRIRNQQMEKKRIDGIYMRMKYDIDRIQNQQMDDPWFSSAEHYDSNIRDAECEGDDEQEYEYDDGEYNEPIAPTPQITEQPIKPTPAITEQPIKPTPQITEQSIKRKRDDDDDEATLETVPIDPEDCQEDETAPMQVHENPFTKKNPKNPFKKLKKNIDPDDDLEATECIIPATKEFVDHKGLEIIPLFEHRHIYVSKE